MSFGLVTIPVHLYSAVDAHDEVKFNLLHGKDKGRIRYKRTCETCGEEVAWGDIVKGIEQEDGQWVEFSDEDFEKADVSGSSTIDIQDFVQAAEIDPKYFERPAYLEPQKGGERPYALLREALRKSEKVGIAKLVIRTRQQLACLKPDGDAILLEFMRFADEVRSMSDLKLPPAEEARERELELAMRLISDMTAPFEITKYKDDYREKLHEMIKEKAAGLVAAHGEAPAATKVTDLMAQLEKSLAERTARPVATTAAVGKPASKPRPSGRQHAARKSKKD
jgi:DNA end-binding protein Ku